MHVRLGAALPQPTAQTRPLHLRASYVLWEERRNRAKAKTHVKNASLHDKTTDTPHNRYQRKCRCGVCVGYVKHWSYFHEPI